MEIRVAVPHGMCTGVARALRIADEALATGEPLWCYHEIVHNAHVVAALEARGAHFVHDLAEIPHGARVLFSAHGVSPAIRAEAAARELHVIDATCPFVAKVHSEARAFARKGLDIALIGHPGHDEVVGTMGEAPERIRVLAGAEDASCYTQQPVAILSQTTVSQAMVKSIATALEARGCTLHFPTKMDVCYATQERQDAVRDLAQHVELVLVIGSSNSSNSKRLVEVAQGVGTRAVLIESIDDLATLDLSGVTRLGVTSGASTPEAILDAIVAKLQARA